MKQRIVGLLLSPIIIIIIGFVVYGEWGAVVALFVGMASVIFIPIFGIVSHSFGITSFLPLVAIANPIPIGFWALTCLGQSCPNYTLAAASPQYVAATFCAFVVWLFVRRS